MALVTVAVLWLGTGCPNNSTQGPTRSLNCPTSGEVGTAPSFCACAAIPVAPSLRSGFLGWACTTAVSLHIVRDAGQYSLRIAIPSPHPALSSEELVCREPFAAVRALLSVHLLSFPFKRF